MAAKPSWANLRQMSSMWGSRPHHSLDHHDSRPGTGSFRTSHIALYGRPPVHVLQPVAGYLLSHLAPFVFGLLYTNQTPPSLPLGSRPLAATSTTAPRFPT